MEKINKNQVLKDLVSIYKKLYSSKDLFSFAKLFKYSDLQVDEVLEHFISTKTTTTTKTATSRKKKSALPELKSKLDAENYYYENMIYDRSDEKAKKKIIAKYSADDLKDLFNILYNSKPYNNKTLNFDEIQRYFDNIERAKHL